MANHLRIATNSTGTTGNGITVPEILSADENRAVRIWAAGAPCPSVTELRQRFRLTPTQARVTQLLVARRTNAEISSILGVSIHTARRHVEAALFRLNVGSRWHVEQRIGEVDQEIPRAHLMRW